MSQSLRLSSELPAKASSSADLVSQAQNADWNLHNTLIEFLGNPIIASAYRVNLLKLRIFRQERTRLNEALVIPTMREHLVIVEALASRDPGKAADAVAARILRARDRALGVQTSAPHEVYFPRIQRGNASFAANVLGARGALLSVLAHFFKQGRWGSIVGTQNLTPEDQLFLLMQAGLYLTHTRGLGAPEARVCYEHAEPMFHSLHRPELLCSGLMSQWVFSLVTDKLNVTMQIAERISRLAQNQNDAALRLGAHQVLAATLYFLGDFEAARQNATCGLQIWSSGVVQSPVEEVYSPAVICLMVETLSEWHLGEVAPFQAAIARAISLAKELNDAHGLAAALLWATILGHLERIPDKVAGLASDLIELSTPSEFCVLAAGRRHLARLGSERFR